MAKQLIDKAYEIAKKEFSGQQFEFSKLWSKLLTAARIKKNDAEELIGEFYTDLTQDTRFILCDRNKQKWCLSEFNLDKCEKNYIEETLYGLNADDEEEYLEKDKDFQTEENNQEYDEEFDSNDETSLDNNEFDKEEE